MTEFTIRCLGFCLPDVACVAEFRIRCPAFCLPGFCLPDFATWSSESKIRSPDPQSATSVHVRFTLSGSPVPLNGAASILNPKAGGVTGDPFGVRVALLSAAAKCFRTWVSVEIPRRRVLLPLLSVTGRCYRAQPLTNIEGATNHQHGMTCVVELFHLRHVPLRLFEINPHVQEPNAAHACKVARRHCKTQLGC